jgi:hypothetical protein
MGHKLQYPVPLAGSGRLLQVAVEGEEFWASKGLVSNPSVSLRQEREEKMAKRDPVEVQEEILNVLQHIFGLVERICLELKNDRVTDLATMVEQEDHAEKHEFPPLP